MPCQPWGGIEQKEDYNFGEKYHSFSRDDEVVEEHISAKFRLIRRRVDSWVMNDDDAGLGADGVDLFHGRPGIMDTCAADSSEDDRFFDPREDFSSSSDSSLDCADGSDSNTPILDTISDKFRYEVWISKPESVRERRGKFLKWLDVGISDRSDRTCTDPCVGADADIGRVMDNSGAVLRSFDPENGSSSNRLSVSASIGTANPSEGGLSEQNFVYKIRNLDDGKEFVIDGLGQDGALSKLREVGSNRTYSIDEFQQVLGMSPFVQQLMRRGATEASDLVVAQKKKKKLWFQRLGHLACVVSRRGGKIQSVSCRSSCTKVSGRRVRVQSSKKRSKELSALFLGQDIQAHKGSILTMKFSPDGRHLASAGEDGIVRVWCVMECERTEEDDIRDEDPSCMYFAVDGSSQLAPLYMDRDKLGKCSSMRKTADSVCVISPLRRFRISESPLHEFHGHRGDVLDLSWSNNQCLLSSSVDNSVRLWKVGHDQCLKVFHHSDYVTCIHFNPEDDNYFISGSIDGKVRIWDIPGCQVVDWTDVREIVTAVCYHPDGKGAIIGSFTGNCRFYNISGNHLSLSHQIHIQGKKKSTATRITGFQYSPRDPSKLMITSSDSQIRILEGSEIVGKYKGLKNGGSQISASFSSDGKHIISASEDSNVYVWSCRNSNETSANHVKSKWSYERFLSSNVSVAIPWSGMKCENLASFASDALTSDVDSQQSSSSSGRYLSHSDSSHNMLSFSSPDNFSLGHGLFPEILPKGSATWPEEKLPSGLLTVSPAVCKYQHKFLKASLASQHAWGLIIVTAGWDGRMRSFHNYGLPVRL